MARMQAPLVGLPVGRRGRWRGGVMGGRMGVGLSDSVPEMDRELEDMGETGGVGDKTGVGAVSGAVPRCAAAALQAPAAYVCVVRMRSKTPSFPHRQQPACVIYVGPLFHCAYTGKSPVYTRIA